MNNQELIAKIKSLPQASPFIMVVRARIILDLAAAN